MCYSLQKPFEQNDKNKFIVTYNHQLGLQIEDTELFLFALEANEIMGEKEIEITIIDGYDEEGNPITHTEKKVVPYPVVDPTYDARRLEEAKAAKHAENAACAKEAVEKGCVEFHGVYFETNAQTVGDLTATMLLLEASGQETYDWLSMDDQFITLTLPDFQEIGVRIAEYKQNVWAVKYVAYKRLIEESKTLDEVLDIVIQYLPTEVIDADITDNE